MVVTYTLSDECKDDDYDNDFDDYDDDFDDYDDNFDDHDDDFDDDDDYGALMMTVNRDDDAYDDE